MDMYLRHYFDPSFDHQELHPDALRNQQGHDLYNLGYAQNAIKGQILAELVPLSEVENPLPRFILKNPVLPQGANTHIHPDYPQYLIADVNGYVFYYGDQIAVKRLLNVRSDVNFHTGNIFFVGDAVVHGDVKAGFSVQANNVLIKGLVEGGEIRARAELKAERGARGATGSRSLLHAGQGLRVAFAEKMELRSRGRLQVDAHCMYCTIYVMGDLVVGSSLVGGVCHAARHVLVKGNVGNRTGIATEIHLGYEPHLIRLKNNFEKRLDVLSERIRHYHNLVGEAPEAQAEDVELPAGETKRSEIVAKLQAAIKKQNMLIALSKDATARQAPFERAAGNCRMAVSGTVYPGTTLSIGAASMVVKEELSNVYFHLDQEGNVVTSPLPSDVGASLAKS